MFSCLRRSKYNMYLIEQNEILYAIGNIYTTEMKNVKSILGDNCNGSKLYKYTNQPQFINRSL